MLDHLLGVLVTRAGFDLELETAPGGGGEAEVDAVGRALGGALAEAFRKQGAVGLGSGVAPADEALAQVVLEVSGRPLVTGNVDLSAAHVGGLEKDLLARFLNALAAEAGLTLHVRLLHGVDTQHVLEAIFKALGLALAQACRAPKSIRPKGNE